LRNSAGLAGEQGRQEVDELLMILAVCIALGQMGGQADWAGAAY